METTIVYWGYIGIMEKNGNNYSTLGLYWDTGKYNGNYDLGLQRTISSLKSFTPSARTVRSNKIQTPVLRKKKIRAHNPKPSCATTWRIRWRKPTLVFPCLFWYGKPMMYHPILYYTIPYYTIPYYTILYYTKP